MRIEASLVSWIPTLCVRRRQLVAAAAVALAAIGTSSHDALAQTTTSYPLSVADCQTATELCTVIPTVTVQTASLLTVNFTASPGHCSDVIVHISADCRRHVAEDVKVVDFH